ncbi:MAG: bifunctional 23S rRNA (guanine(2069)-N(7))-methyltransferase RlmK/23S rRNA (guanine(2445)-N(2))-methyltransferase RlmL [Gammaproteobacteria bacterium]
MDFYAVTAKGMEQLLLEELQALGAETSSCVGAGVNFSGPLALAYRACLWSRVANRILLPIAQFPAATPEALYAGVQAVDWDAHLAAEGTLAVDCNISESQINHSHYAALKVKDAIVDQLRDRHDIRPSVDTERPDLRLNLYLRRDQATLSIDLSGSSLHRRGYREQGVEAPLKENLAAAILLRAGWPTIAGAGGAFIDPMCGSGTLPIEAALIAADCAPGLTRDYFGFLGWRQHDAAVWQSLRDEAVQRRSAGLRTLSSITGYDAQPAAVRAAQANVARAGLQGCVHIERRELAACAPLSPHDTVGLIATNPPYGERLGEIDELAPLYSALGACFKARFQNWRAAVFTGNPQLGMQIGLRARRRHAFFNGAIPCQLLSFDVVAGKYLKHTTPGRVARIAEAPTKLSEGATMFANRLRKNARHLARWAKRSDVYCYRVYDADLPEYAFAIDRYENWVQVQEYAAPRDIEAEKVRHRRDEVLAALPQVLDVPAEHVILKVRRRQRGSDQYDKQGDERNFLVVREGPARFQVNLTDYLDTGLFLDARPIRALIKELAAGRRFLNLFAYTGTATVYAALGGATATTTVDMSAVYLDWARRNLALNGFSDRQHTFVHADCLRWLQAEQQRYGLIFLDPPTFSNSKRMTGSFDVQRDHVALIRAATALLDSGGILLFACNRRGFTLDVAALTGFDMEDITRHSIPEDFSRDPKVHVCWKITRVNVWSVGRKAPPA